MHQYILPVSTRGSSCLRKAVLLFSCSLSHEAVFNSQLLPGSTVWLAVIDTSGSQTNGSAVLLQHQPQISARVCDRRDKVRTMGGGSSLILKERKANQMSWTTFCSGAGLMKLFSKNILFYNDIWIKNRKAHHNTVCKIKILFLK